MYHSLKNDPTKGDQSTANAFDLYLTKGPGVKFDLQLNPKMVNFFVDKICQKSAILGFWIYSLQYEVQLSYPDLSYILPKKMK